MILTFGSLFAGIGGIDLGLERAGMTCKWQVEIDDYATKILEKHWPNVTRFRDVRDCGAHNLKPVDLICGGFPCQDISNAGKRAGIKGKQSGLWSEFHRIICELKPKYVLVENVSALLVRGMGTVLGDLAKSGYDAEWQSLSAATLGAPHKRDRVFIVAYPQSYNAKRAGRCFDTQPSHYSEIGPELWHKPARYRTARIMEGWTQKTGQSHTNILRVADGIPHRVDRLGTLGNAVVPQVAEWLGNCIIQWDSNT